MQAGHSKGTKAGLRSDDDKNSGAEGEGFSLPEFSKGNTGAGPVGASPGIFGIAKAMVSQIGEKLGYAMDDSETKSEGDGSS